MHRISIIINITAYGMGKASRSHGYVEIHGKMMGSRKGGWKVAELTLKTLFRVSTT